MDWFSPVELIGYLASALIVVSLAMTSVVRLRVISLIGSITFVVYGLLIGAPPIVLSNAIIAGINVYYLRRELGPNRELGAVPVAPDAPFLADFLARHADDIAADQPGFTGVPDNAFALMLMRRDQPAGLLVGERHRGDLNITLDYVLAPYRDLRLGRWLYGDGAKYLRDAAFSRAVATPGSSAHEAYLRRLGFVPAGEGRMVKDL